MIVGFDAKRAFTNHTGLGNYSRYVINTLSRYFPDCHYRLYAPKETHNFAMDRLRKQDNITLSFPKGLYTHFPSLWRMKGIPADLRRDGIQLYHGLSNELPLGIQKTNIRTVVTIHDLIFLRYPQFYKAADRAIYAGKFKHACRMADTVIAISECTKRDIVYYFDINPGKVQVIYQGCDVSFGKQLPFEERRQICGKYRLPNTYILNVGTIENRKNLLLAVKALQYTDGQIHLVAVGRETPYTREVKEYAAKHGLEKRIHLLSGIPLADLPALYQSAAVFVYPSIFEGFGIPVIEALHSGIPVIAATGSCLEEAGGTHSIYVDPADEKQLADAVNRVVADDALRTDMITAGKKHVARFDDRLLASKIMDLYKKY